ncbi:DUF2867 domain-containing protein [Dactylosporangium sp. NBC_01737]|uniref:DUF2867 domain-containing protein n=1 Tax=Dactylosporangium sp. NBC_01737 TaxID=2975959 RepID=UPI002E11544B|nr:DUF2867 domain-containing protein [Dactylosporangium sp. NBC_01737]
MQNVQSRTIDAPADRMGALLDRLATPDDPLWPTPAWPPMRFDRPLTPGATGGHGMIRYTVLEHVPGRLLRCRFDPTIGVLGEHELRIDPAATGTGTTVTHVIRGDLTGAMRILWPVAIRWLHEALLQDLLDNAERAGTGTVREPARWSLWVRLMRRAAGRAGAGRAGAAHARTRNAGAGQTGAASAGVSSTGASPTGASPTGASPTGASPTGASPAGASPTGASPAGASPTGASPTGASPAGASPAGAAHTETGNAGAGRSDAGRIKRPRRVPLPGGARLAAGTLDHVDLMDAWQGTRPPGASTDPAAWRAAMFGRPPRWVGTLMRLRNRIPGLEPLDTRDVFAPLDARDDEVLFGADTRHFNLRISLFVDAESVVCSTLTRPRTRRGRAYLAVVSRVHPLVVRTMLARALRAAPFAPAT